MARISYTPAPAAPAASIAIGDPITLGTANRVLFEGALNTLQESDGLNYVAGGTLQITSTTQKQLSLLYDGSNKIDITAGATGRVTLQGTGADKGVLFIDQFSLGAAAPNNDVKMWVQNKAGITSSASFVTNDFSLFSTGTAVSLLFSAASGDTNASFQCSKAGASVNSSLCFQPFGGDIGIGTTAPSQGLLHMVKSANSATTLFIDNATSGTAAQSALVISYNLYNIYSGISTLSPGFTDNGLLVKNSSCWYSSGATAGMRFFTFDSSGVKIGTNNTEAINVDASQHTQFAGKVRLKVYTVATLPAGVIGDTAVVSDALAPAFLVAVAGGGAAATPVFYTGAAWVCF